MSLRKVQDHPTGFELNREKGFWTVAVPEPTFNLIKNPSFEGSSVFTNVSASAGCVVDTAWRAFGKNSLFCPIDNAGYFVYTQPNTESIFTPLKDYTWSFYAKGTPNANLKIEIAYQAAGQTIITTKTIVTTGEVERLAITFNVPAAMATGHSIKLILSNPAGITQNINIDAFQLEPKAYLTTYVDGDQAGGSWLGVPYASFSARSAVSPGGRIYDFKKDFGFSVMASPGAGMPDMDHQTTDQVYLGGKVVQRTLPVERVITLIGALEARSNEELLTKIDAMTQALAPATGSQVQLPLKLKYTPFAKTAQAGQEVEATVLCAGGMPGEFDKLWQARYAIQFEEFVPVGFSETVEQYQALNIQSGALAGNAFIKRATGEWSFMPRSASPASPTTLRLLEDQNKSIYVAYGNGTAFQIDKIKNNPITNTESIEATWTGFNGPINAMAVLPETGEILVAGNFTAPQNYTAKLVAGGTTAAFFNTTGVVNAIYVDPTGYVFLGGSFTVGFAQMAVALDFAGTLVQPLMFSHAVRAIAAGPQTGQAYFGGDFVTAGPGNIGAAQLAFVDIFAPSAPSYNNVNGGVNGGYVYALAIGPDGSLYVGGYFTQDNNTGGPPFYSLLRIAKLVNNRLVQVGGGVGTTGQGVTSMDFDSAGNLYVCVGNSYIVFDGTRWQGMENGSNGVASAGQLLITSDNRQIHTWSNDVAYFYYAGVTDIVNKGSAPAYPKIKIYGPASPGAVVVHKITNFTTGANLFLEYGIRFGETLTLDFTNPRNIQITSNLFGNVKSKMVSTSQFARFFLAPGRNGAVANRLVFHTDSNLGSAEISWHNTYWGVEGSVK